MKLFHGSNCKIDNIDLSVSKTNKDFGFGFYLSDNFQQASLMADFRVSIEGGTPLVTEFEIEDESLEMESLKIKRFSEYSKEWAEFILQNRTNSSRKQIHDYDIVVGPIADDKVGAQIRRLENGDINLNEFLKRIKYIKGVTFQYFFGTERAVSLLRRLR